VTVSKGKWVHGFSENFNQTWASSQAELKISSRCNATGGRKQMKADVF
jgi:hypothetical protein